MRNYTVALWGLKVWRAPSCWSWCCWSSHSLSPSQEYFLQAELTSNVLKTGVVHCCVGQCNNTIPVDTILTMRKLPITYVRSL